jgi:hypothetical protein
VNVIAEAPIVKLEPGAYTVASGLLPVSQPMKSNPVLVGADGRAKVAPYIVFACVGAVLAPVPVTYVTAKDSAVHFAYKVTFDVVANPVAPTA